MRSIVRVLGPLLLGVGALLLGDAVATGAARLYLFLIFPVLTGTSAVFAVSVFLIVVGFFLLPFAFLGSGSDEGATPESSRSSTASERSESGGVILLGPVPIYFGAWRRNPPIAYWWMVLLGVALAVVAVLFLWAFSVL